MTERISNGPNIDIKMSVPSLPSNMVILNEDKIEEGLKWLSNLKRLYLQETIDLSSNGIVHLNTLLSTFEIKPNQVYLSKEECVFLNLAQKHYCIVELVDYTLSHYDEKGENLVVYVEDSVPLQEPEYMRYAIMEKHGLKGGLGGGITRTTSYLEREHEDYNMKKVSLKFT